MKVIRRGGGVEGENLIYKFAAIFVAEKIQHETAEQKLSKIRREIHGKTAIRQEVKHNGRNNSKI